MINECCRERGKTMFVMKCDVDLHQGKEGG